MTMTLHNGKPTCSWSRAWMRECEARQVIAMPAADMVAYRGLVEKHRGASGVADLRALIQSIKAANAAQGSLL